MAKADPTPQAKKKRTGGAKIERDTDRKEETGGARKAEAETDRKTATDRKTEAETDRKAGAETDRKAEAEADRKEETGGARKAEAEADRKAEAEEAAAAAKAKPADTPEPTGSLYALHARRAGREAEAAAVLGKTRAGAGAEGEPEEPPAAGPGPSRAYVDNARIKRFLPEGGAELRGRLVDATSGGGVAGAQVEAWMGTRSLHVGTDDDGRFVFEGLAPGSRLTLWMTGPGHFVQERSELAVPKQEVSFSRNFALLDKRTAAGSTTAGIGVFLARTGNRTVINGLVAFGPAEAAGATTGDAILAVDGRDVRGLGPGAVAYLLGGKVGSSVEITLQREGGAPRKVVMKRVGK